MQQAQFYPNRLSITPERTRKSHNERIEAIWRKNNPKEFKENFPELYAKRQKSLDNLTNKNHPFQISQSGRKALLDSINSLFLLSPPRTITTKKRKKLYNFRASFITLTLPSPQMHPDLLFKEKCLHQLFVELRKFYQVQNYVWKAELQKNGNIHFHIITDQYIDYYALRHRWNRIINKYHYVDEYAKKWLDIPLKNYIISRCGTLSNFTALTIDRRSKIINAWREGTRTKWRRPNTVDIRPVRSGRELASYLGKYISKNIKKGAEDPLQDLPHPDIFNGAKLGELASEIKQNARESTFGRSWYRSLSLSRLKYKNKFEVQDLQKLIAYFRENLAAVKEFSGQWFTVFYFHLDLLSTPFQRWFNGFIKNNAARYNYYCPSG